MGSSDQLLVFYSRIDAFGDGLLRIPALRAARTAFPRSRIVYASSGPSTLEKLLRRHLDGLVDDFRTATPLAAVVSEFRRRGGQTIVADFRNLLPKLLAARMAFLGSGIHYRPTSRALDCPGRGAGSASGPNTMPGAFTGWSSGWRDGRCPSTIGCR